MSNKRSGTSASSGLFTGGSYTFVQEEKWCKCDSSSSESAVNEKYWLNRHGSGKCYSYEQLNILDANLGFLNASYLDGYAKSSTEKQLIEEYYPCHSQNDAALSSDEMSQHLRADAKSPKHIQLREFGPTSLGESRKVPMGKETEHYWPPNLEGMDDYDYLDFERPNKLCSDLDSDLIGLKQVEPWWHAADTDDFAILASQKLPFVAHTVHGVKSSGDSINCAEQNKKGTANSERKLPHVVNGTQGNLASVNDEHNSCVAEHSHGNITSNSMNKSPDDLGSIERMLQGSDGSLSGLDSSTAKPDLLDTHELGADNLSRVELLEALCHSQTRAREAEKLAQTAYDEKENVVDLFFRQASYLFAYRQWLRMLQLETLCLQLGTKNQSNSSTPPALLPWIRSKGIPLRKKRRGSAKKKPGQRGCHVCKYAFAFALGLGLAGAGLLVGWTIGWLFPNI